MLDDLSLYQRLDPGDMHSLLVDFYRQFVDGRAIGENADLGNLDPDAINMIVLAGMGGSAIGGDLLRCYLMDKMKIPFIVNRDYTLPAFVGEDALVVLSSYSGNTEETLSALVYAQEAGSQLLAITSGGRLAQEAEKHGFPLIEIPSGLPPRSALGYSFVPLLKVLERLELVPPQDEALEETQIILMEEAKNLSRDIPENENPAKQLAKKLHKKLPLIYSSPVFEAVATRFRGQINENGKALAYSAVVPEMNHNELVGWKYLYELASSLAPVFLKDVDDHPRNIFRMEFVSEVMEELGVETIFLEPPAVEADLMGRMFSLIQLGDFTSYYIAILNNEDPKPVKIIDRLKSALAEKK